MGPGRGHGSAPILYGWLKENSDFQVAPCQILEDGNYVPRARAV